MSPHAFIVVHGGAGVHGTKYDKEVKLALKKACLSGIYSLKDMTRSSSSLEVVERSVAALENDEHLNAGYGSNLTIDGTVECDASIMCSGSLDVCPDAFGSVGALSGIKNPILAARAVLEHSKKSDKLGRIPPLTLASDGARKFAIARGVPSVPPDSLISPSAKANWEKWKSRLDASATALGTVDAGVGGAPLQDTVGAVVFIDGEWPQVSAGVSSGGLLLKHPGRIGEAAAYGVGCWTSVSECGEGVACSVSGTGEHIIKMNLARRIGEALSRPNHPSAITSASEQTDNDPHSVLESLLSEFWSSCKKDGEEVPSAGVILLTTTPNESEVSSNSKGGSDDEVCPQNFVDVKDSTTDPCVSKANVRLWCAFTTASMAVGYASTGNPKPKATIFRHPSPHRFNDKSGGEEKPQIYITSISLSL